MHEACHPPAIETYTEIDFTFVAAPGLDDSDARGNAFIVIGFYPSIAEPRASQ
jgi:hypothetical protein